jgi:transcriptional regulator with XRE-family HTH domain
MAKPRPMTAAELKAVRKGLGLLQADFAARLGIGVRTYIRYERGDRAVPLVVALAVRYLRDK